MNITSPIADFPARPRCQRFRVLLLGAFGDGTGLFGDSPEAARHIMSALAGIAAALAVAILLSVYFRNGYRSRRDLRNMASPFPPRSSCSPS